MLTLFFQISFVRGHRAGIDARDREKRKRHLHRSCDIIHDIRMWTVSFFHFYQVLTAMHVRSIVVLVSLYVVTGSKAASSNAVKLIENICDSLEGTHDNQHGDDRKWRSICRKLFHSKHDDQDPDERIKQILTGRRARRHLALSSCSCWRAFRKRYPQQQYRESSSSTSEQWKFRWRRPWWKYRRKQQRRR